MLFNSSEFLVFFAIVYGFYVLLNHRWQNRMLLLASYWFYGSWDWRFLSLLFISTIVDFLCGLKIAETPTIRRKRVFLAISVVTNLSILGFFKYYNFFVESLEIFLQAWGIPFHPFTLSIILPVGISFYTFQTMSYTIDVYRGEMEATRKIDDFALFVAFFPQLVAGPIERARNLLPQILSPRTITLQGLKVGAYLIAWGLFQKVFVADNLAKIADPVFGAPPPYNGPELVLAWVAFSFQILCDFAGYSNIAKGLGSLMGFEIMTNFNLPYFSKTWAEFWRRWHISLSGWLKDYLYLSIKSCIKSEGKAVAAFTVIITFMLGGLWHGAKWTFIIWGTLHGIMLVIERSTSGFREALARKMPPVVFSLVSLVGMCSFWLIAGVFFRAQSVPQVLQMYYGFLTNWDIIDGFLDRLLYLMYFVVPLVAVDMIDYISGQRYAVLSFRPVYKTIFFLSLLYLCLYVIFLGQNALIGGGSEFIYFQF